MAELSEVKKLVLGLSDCEIMALLGLRSGKNKRNTDSSGRADGSWMIYTTPTDKKEDTTHETVH